MKNSTLKKWFYGIGLWLLASVAIAYLVAVFLPIAGFNMLEDQHVDGDFTIQYIDLDNDGISEYLRYRNHPETGRFILEFRDRSDGIIEYRQFKYFVKPMEVLLDDYDNDGIDEAFVFTHNDSAVFLSMIRLGKNALGRDNAWIIRERVIEKRSEKSMEDSWGMTVRPGVLCNLDSDPEKELIFAVNAGLPLQPRSLCVFDITEQQITRRFNINAPFQSVISHVPENNSEPYILATTSATNNVKDTTLAYRDNRCWWFVLDSDLKTVRLQKSFSEGTSTLKSSVMTVNSISMAVLTYSYSGVDPLPSWIKIFDLRGNALAERTVNAKSVDVFFQNEKSSVAIYAVTFEPTKIARLDQQLNGQFKVLPREEGLQIWGVEDLDADGKSEVIVVSNHNIHIYDEHLQHLTKWKPPAPIEKQGFTFKRSGPGQPIDLAVTTKTGFAMLRFSQKPFPQAWLFYWRWIFTVGSGFLLLMGLSLQNISARKMISSTFDDPDNAVLLLNAYGIVEKAGKGLVEQLPQLSTFQAGASFRDFLQAYPELAKTISTNLERAESWRKKIEYSSDHPLLISGTVITSIFGRPNFRLIRFERLAAPEASERWQSWRSTVQQIAHDMKTPLAALIMRIDTLKMRLKQAEKGNITTALTDLDKMRAELKHLENYTIRFLRFIEAEQPKPEKLSFADEVRQVLIRMEESIPGGITVSQELEPDLPALWADPHHLLMILQIIIENAVQALGNSGLVQINAWGISDPDTFSKPMARIEIADNGPGVDPKIAEKIFDPLVTGKKNGTGLGLTLAKKMSEANGGNIGFYSKPDFATVLWINLPAFNAQIAARKGRR